jgi:hypothetical protein
MPIIAISGHMGSGKDTVGRLIQYANLDCHVPVSLQDIVLNQNGAYYYVDSNSRWKIKKFAGKLKEICSLLINQPVSKFENREFKDEELGPEWDYLDSGGALNKMTIRKFMQRLGTDACRDVFHPNIWVNALMADYVPYTARGSSYEEIEERWIITDCRFINEATEIKKRGGHIIRVNRESPDQQEPHASETELDNWDFDYVINNNNNTDYYILYEQTVTMLKSLNK